MRSKADPVDQPERTAHYDCAMCIAKMLHNTIAQRQCIILLSPDHHYCSDEAKWRLGCDALHSFIMQCNKLSCRTPSV